MGFCGVAAVGLGNVGQFLSQKWSYLLEVLSSSSAQIRRAGARTSRKRTKGLSMQHHAIPATWKLCPMSDCLDRWAQVTGEVTGFRIRGMTIF